MTIQATVEQIGDKIVLPLSPEIVRKLELKSGATVDIIEVENEIVLRRSVEDDDDKKFREITKSVFKDYKEVFTALAEGAK